MVLFHLRISLLHAVLFFPFYSMEHEHGFKNQTWTARCDGRAVSPHLFSAPSLPADRRSPGSLAGPLCMCFAQMSSYVFISWFSLHLYTFPFPLIINWKSSLLSHQQSTNVQMKVSLCGCRPACGPGGHIPHSQWWTVLKRTTKQIHVFVFFEIYIQGNFRNENAGWKDKHICSFVECCQIPLHDLCTDWTSTG